MAAKAWAMSMQKAHLLTAGDVSLDEQAQFQIDNEGLGNFGHHLAETEESRGACVNDFGGRDNLAETAFGEPIGQSADDGIGFFDGGKSHGGTSRILLLPV